MTAGIEHQPRRHAGRILIVYLGQLTNVARVARHVDFLRADYEVVVAAWGPDPRIPGAEFIELPTTGGSRAAAAGRIALRLADRYDQAYWRDPRMRHWRALIAAALPLDAILVNHLAAVPLALAVDRSVPVIFDAHEHWTSESVSWTWRQRRSMRGAHEWIVDRHVPRTAAMMTVSAGIARDFHARCGVSPRLVTNAPFFEDLLPTAVDDERIRLVHVGLADERRRLEDTIEAVTMLDDRFSLDLILGRDNAYRRRLEKLAAQHARIRVLAPVPSNELLSVANRYDVGVFLLPGQNPNQVHVLPNKLFDYIQARLAVAIGPSVEMAAIVRQWDCGVVSESFEPASLAVALAALDGATVERMKRNADRAAQVLTAERNRDIVREVVGEAVRRGSA
jgi:glycosyltransferase involved in cell wall biosynthesis